MDSWGVIQSFHSSRPGLTPNWDVPTMWHSAIPQHRPKKGTWNEVIAQTTRHLTVVCWLRTVARGPRSWTAIVQKQTIGCVVGIVFRGFIGFVFDLSLRLVVKGRRMDRLQGEKIYHVWNSQHRSPATCLFLLFLRKSQCPFTYNTMLRLVIHFTGEM